MGSPVGCAPHGSIGRCAEPHICNMRSRWESGSRAKGSTKGNSGVIACRPPRTSVPRRQVRTRKNLIRIIGSQWFHLLNSASTASGAYISRAEGFTHGPCLYSFIGCTNDEYGRHQNIWTLAQRSGLPDWLPRLPGLHQSSTSMPMAHPAIRSRANPVQTIQSVQLV